MSTETNPTHMLRSLSDATAAMVEHVSPSLVTVKTGRHHQGSGVIWTNDGYIITCRHVISRSDTVTVSLVDGTTHTAQVVGRDRYSDLAVLKIDRQNLTPISHTPEHPPKVGQFVVAMAKASEHSPAATWGMITSVDFTLPSWRGISIENALITDAQLNPGYSGGPLVDVEGHLIGLNTAYAQSRGIAIPLATIVRVTDSIIENGQVPRAYLGIQFTTVPLPSAVTKSLDLTQSRGLLVLGVEPDTPAKDAGLLLGDIIVAFNDMPMNQTYDLSQKLTDTPLNKPATITLIRSEQLHTVTITPIPRPAN